MDAVKVNLAAVNVKLNEVGENLDRNEKKLDRNEKRVETNVKAIKDDVVAKFKIVQEQLKKQEESNRQLKTDNVEIKKSLNEMSRHLERLTQQTPHEVQAEQEHEKKGIAEADGMDREPKVVVAGGWNGGTLNSVEMFTLSKATWEPLQPTKDPHHLASSVVYNNQVFVTAGYCDGHAIKSIEKLSMNAVEVDQSITWENCPAELRGLLYGHCSVVYNGRLIVIGGYDGKHAYSDNITELSLVPPYTSKVLATIPQKRWLHCVVLFGGKIVILGGRKDWDCSTNFKSVLLYDIAKNECKELTPLPYPVSEMAAVKWGDDNFIIVGGIDSDDKPLNKVLMYSIKSQKSFMLPDMKYKRRGCVAAVVRDTLIVMGGRDDRENCLKSAESFRFDRVTWEELPEMQEARYGAAAVVC